jgi:prolyl-tRNA synthetase
MGKLPPKENFSEWFTEIVSPEGADLADVRYGVQGFIVHRPYGMRMIRRIYDLLEAEAEADGHEPVLFPTVIKQEYLQREADHAGFTPEVFWVEKAGTVKLEEPLALRPTGETQFYPLFSLWIRSHNQLPYKTYQSRHTVFRNEMTTRPFMRGREFCFMETHNAYANHDQLQVQIDKDLEMMQAVIHGKLRLPFYFFKRPKWDAFLGADATYTADTLMPDGRRNQLSSTHDLGTNFAKAFDITFTDEAGMKQYAYQSCWGPGVWRIMAALIAVHGDDQGLVLPTSVAPVQAVIIPIFKNEEEEGLVRGAIDELTKRLDVRTFVDWSKQTPGYKFNQWEMKGVPLRIEVGPRDVASGSVVVRRRLGKEKAVVHVKELVSRMHTELKTHDEEIDARSKQYFADNTRTADTLSEIKAIMSEFRGFVITNWCELDGAGKACAETLKAETQGAYVCGERMDEQQSVPNGARCAVCSKEARHRVYLAKSY